MGFAVNRFTGTVDQNLLCSICSCVLEDAVLTPCGHSFCQLCLHTWIQVKLLKVSVDQGLILWSYWQLLIACDFCCLCITISREVTCKGRFSSPMLVPFLRINAVKVMDKVIFVPQVHGIL